MSQIIEAAKCHEKECRVAHSLHVTYPQKCSGPKCAHWEYVVICHPDINADLIFSAANTMREQEESTHGCCGLSSK